jgi:hypothetical protein
MHTAKLQKKSSKNAWGKLLFFSESIFQFTLGLNTVGLLCTKSNGTTHGGGWEDGIRKAARQLEWRRLGSR